MTDFFFLIQQAVVEEKRPVQVNLAELMKQTGIVDDDESFFMDEEPAPMAPPPVQQLPVETKENNVNAFYPHFVAYEI